MTSPNQTHRTNQTDETQDGNTHTDADRFVDDNPRPNNTGGTTVKLNPMSQLAASSTVVNLLLATGPFTFPYSFVGLGPWLSGVILACTCFLAYITATFMIEAVSLAASVKPGSDDIKRRHESLFHE